MSIEDELLALAGDSDEDDGDVRSEASRSSPPQPQPSPHSNTGAMSPKKRSRAAPARVSRKKQRRDSDGGRDDDDVKDEDSGALSDQQSAEPSDNEREAVMDMDSDSGSDGEDGGEPSLYPLEGKYKDYADKEALRAMTEIDREAVLAERMAQIEREQQDRHLRNLLKSRNAADRAKGAAAAAASTRKSLRTKSAPKKTEEATKRGKLDELRRNREERKATGRRSSFGEEDASRKILSDGEEEDFPHQDAYVVKEERPIELADVNGCRIGRTALGKLLDYPGFEETVIDFFVRIAMFDKESNRQIYRMAQIKGFKTGKMYAMLDGSRKTDQHVRVTHGKSEREFPMDMMSDSRFTEAELNRFKNQHEIDKVPLPTLLHLRNKAAMLTKLSTRSLTPQELEAIIAKRNAGKDDYIRNITKRRALEDQREEAVLAGDEDRVAQLDQELQELEDLQAGPARAETQMQRMARINAENRKRNMAEVRRAEIAEKRAARAALVQAEAKGGSFANPFMRVKTMVKFRHDMGGEVKDRKSSASPPKEEVVNGGGVGILAAETTAPPIKGRRRGVDDVIASMDLGIEIDL